MKRIPFILLSFLLLLTVAACAQENNSAQAELDYDQTKKMIIDILKTDQGKNAIQDVLKDEKMKQALILDETVVKQTIQDTMTSEEGQKFWEKMFKDPQFSASFAKSVQKEQGDLMKVLLKDPQYQAGVIDILKNPEVEKQMLEVMKSKEYRLHLQQMLNETAESPLFQTKMIDVISKAIEKANKKS
ncbi:spore germination lipoprotein GerD [Ectobacillus funiculus]|uniref:Spore germination lipoprotein GerD n=1 Tax=Ectobacillus funiculus TaxID=137993 RepID=A0ABV5WBJ0_9BACI